MRQKKGPEKNLKNKISKWIKRFAIAIVIVFCAVSFMNWVIEDDGTWKPDYPKVDLDNIVGKTALTETDYQTIYLQTGLGKDAADKLIREKVGDNRIRIFKEYQENFFSSGNYVCRRVAVIVYEERLRDRNGSLVKGFEIPDLRDGDILITKATHSIGWRHGHAAIVTNAANGETLEAILLGNPAILQNISKWQTYPSFIQLRLKNDENLDAEKIAKYAKMEMKGLPYGLLTGIPAKSPETIKKTQCSHLVWYPYERFGFDLDSDGSWLVTPNDIANSDLLEVVQVYGVNPEEIWP